MASARHHPHRKLSAILQPDVVGYSRLMGKIRPSPWKDLNSVRSSLPSNPNVYTIHDYVSIIELIFLHYFLIIFIDENIKMA